MPKTGSVLTDDTLYQKAVLVDCAADAEIEVLYDKIEYDWKQKVLLYMRHGYLVATATMQGTT